MAEVLDDDSKIDPRLLIQIDSRMLELQTIADAYHEALKHVDQVLEDLWLTS